MTSPSPAIRNPRNLVLVVGVAAALCLAAILLLPPAPSTSPHHGPQPPFATRCGQPLPAGQFTIVSCAGSVTNTSTVTTLPVPVTSGSLNLLFVSWVNSNAGGGFVQYLGDSLGDSYLSVACTGYPELNHSECLYAANISTDTTLTASVTFGGGETTQGGSVATVDVANASLASIDRSAVGFGEVGPATVHITTSRSGDLFLLGTAGRGVSAPYIPEMGETLLSTGSSTSGPFLDGTGYGTFATASSETDLNLEAGLNATTGWDGIAVAVANSSVVPPPVSSVCTPPTTAPGPRVVGCAGVVEDSTPVSTMPYNVTAGSLNLVFVSYVNILAGGGGPESVTDSLGDVYYSITGTGTSLNHTETLYATNVSTTESGFSVTVVFGGGATPQGGSVGAVDVANATLGSIDGAASNTGDSAVANVSVSTTRSGDLFLLGTAGRGVSGPYSPWPGESLLNTGTNTSGPYQDGTGYGTFAMGSAATDVTLAAYLNVATGWDAVGVAVANGSLVTPPESSRCTVPSTSVGPQIGSCTGSVGNGTPVSTLPFNVTAESLNLVFVSYINSLAGGGGPESVSDTLGDSYTLLESTGLALNHTESLYGADVATTAINVTVSVLFGGGVTLQGGSVATVDVAGATLRSVDNFAENTGLWGPANVTLTTSQSGDLFLLGAAGRGVSGPYSAGPGETLLDTGTATSGPFEDGTGYGTFATSSTATSLTLSANLNYSTFWDAIGVAVSSVPLGPPSLVAHAGAVNNLTTVATAPIDAAADSLVLAFVSYVNWEAGGGTPTSVVDSAGDTFTLLATTGDALNHSEDLYAAHLVQGDPTLVVSVTFGGGVTPQGGSVAVADVANATLATIDGISETTGTGGLANVTVTANHTGDLYLFGTAGRGVSAPYSPGLGMALLDTGTNTSGPFLDGTGYGTFTTTSSSTAAFLSATLNVATGWDAIGVAIDP